ncbi:MAG TPA: precorrin-6y C5,15-methyltransferase (decarboxylating) subunit CbiE [Streptosporangiaceae bacterium]|nr:precorrin-6y C5,15-methyltransferase (decarboxylating) subunit CbiE [Streptosporangiaceae bacterium]
MGEPDVITVIGLDGSPLSEQARDALAAATLLVGGRRQLDCVHAGRSARRVVLGPVAPALAALAGHDGDAVVLASGDPGFFGIVRALRSGGFSCTVLPAVSSVAMAFARSGMSWDDAMVVSAHGRDLRHAVNVCRAHPKVAVLTGPGAGPAELGPALAGWDRRLVVAENLGSASERITDCQCADAAYQDWHEPNVVLVLAGARDADAGPGWSWPAAPVVGGWALPEEDFDSRDAVMTKSEVRALALARLAPGPGTLIWDVGAGSGSVGVECARFGAAVIAVERAEVRCRRIRDNARRHGVDVRVIQGEATGMLDGLPDPDAVFVGGGGPAVVSAVAARKPARIVAAVAAIERAGPVYGALEKAGYSVEGALLQASRISPLPGGVHRLAAVNPVLLLWTAPRQVAAGPAERGGA